MTVNEFQSIRSIKKTSANDSLTNDSMASSAADQFQQSMDVARKRSENGIDDVYGQNDALSRPTTSSLYDTYACGSNFAAPDASQQTTNASPFVLEVLQ